MNLPELPDPIKEVLTYPCGCVITLKEGKLARLVISTNHLDRYECPVFQRFERLTGGKTVWFPNTLKMP